MVCENCNGEGRKVGKKRENKITFTVYTLCLCPTGRELEKLWEQYPAWVGAPYNFFHSRKLDSGNPDDVITGGM